MDKINYTVRELFTELGGVTAVSKLLNISVHRVGMWQTREKIQDGYLEVLQLKRPNVFKKLAKARP